MISLGIESTAHTFGCSVVEVSLDNRKSGTILSDVREVYKGLAGSGIHPREASRHHCNVCSEVLKKSLQQAKMTLKELDVIAYSAGPGLGPCLRIGAVAARAIAAYYGKPLVPVHHAIGHIELGAMLTGACDPLVLLVSGGHTMILAFSENRWRIFGETLDITIGQLLDQLGRTMGFASPCGSKIESLADQSSKKYLRLPYAVKGNDVSFSGVLTSAIRLASNKNNTKQDVCYSVQETAFAMMMEALERAISFTHKKEIMIVGGVAANKRLSEMAQGVCGRHHSNFYVCPPAFAGDNGVQIAWTAILDYGSSKNRHINIEKSFLRQSWRLDSIDIIWRN